MTTCYLVKADTNEVYGRVVAEPTDEPPEGYKFVLEVEPIAIQSFPVPLESLGLI